MREGPFILQKFSPSFSLFEVFRLNPMPYRVLLILGVVSFFLAISWYNSYESVVEAAEQQTSLVLMAAPLLLLILVRWLSSIENSDRLFFFFTDYRNQRTIHQRPPEGSSPWGVAALIMLLLIMISYQSTFHDSWFV